MIPRLGPVLFVIGMLLIPLGLGMVVPAIVDAGADHEDWTVFMTAAGVTVFFGALLMLSNRSPRFTLDRRQAFLLTTLSWVIMPAFAALPFSFAQLRMSYTGAYFEAMSGLTTTGATTLSGLDTMPEGILLWRAMLQGFGGAGIIVIAIAVLPFLRVGGMQLFRLESSEQGERVLPRAAQVASMTISVYLGLIVLCLIAYWAAGMSFFDAVCHSLSTISTGGFTTHDESMAHYDSLTLDSVGTAFMFLGGLPMVLFYRTLLRRDWRILCIDQQVRLFFIVCLVGIAILGVWRVLETNVDFGTAFRHAGFMFVSLVTSTGFASTDYAAWSGLADIVLLFAMLAGACTGSTTGGIKVFRFNMMFGVLQAHIHRLNHPHVAQGILFNDRTVPESVAVSALLLIVAFVIAFVVVAVGLSAFGFDLLTSFSAAASTLGNAGGGLGPIIGGGQFDAMPDGALWLLSFAMLLGRLELFTVLILFTRRFWGG
jgi:trk system potassium uptake protein TrkH